MSGRSDAIRRVRPSRRFCPRGGLSGTVGRGCYDLASYVRGGSVRHSSRAPFKCFRCAASYPFSRNHRRPTGVGWLASSA